MWATVSFWKERAADTATTIPFILSVIRTSLENRNWSGVVGLACEYFHLDSGVLHGVLKGGSQPGGIKCTKSAVTGDSDHDAS